jgi:glycosyltransferase involved in cell wall biosynthesis
VITLTNAEKKVLIELGVAEEKIAVTGHAPILAEQANPQAFREKYHINEPIVLFLGQHHSYKGYQQLLEAAPIVWQKIPEANFVFIGPPIRKSEIAFTKLEDSRIHRLGSLSLQEKTDALAACHLLCVPSTQESFGGVYTEAWNFAKPVIGCNIPAVAEVVHHGIDGYLVQQNPAEIASAISNVLLNPSQAEQMGIAGKQKLEMQYNWKYLAHKTEEIYYQVLHS